MTSPDIMWRHRAKRRIESTENCVVNANKGKTLKTLFFGGKTLFFGGKTLFFCIKTLIFCGETVYFCGKTIYIGGKTCNFDKFNDASIKKI